MAWKKRFSFTAKFIFETEAQRIGLIEDIAKNLTDSALKNCKELEADLLSVDYQRDLEILTSTSQTVGDPFYGRKSS